MRCPRWYYAGTGRFLRFVRFLNLLEPERPVLSMTKVLLWGTTIQTFVLIHSSADWTQIAGAAGINIAAMAKHEMRRAAQDKEETQ